ncbi:ornithine decarboxylase [Ixodes scapularis]
MKDSCKMEIDNQPLVYVDEKIAAVARKVIKQQTTDGAFFVCDVRDLDYKVKLWHQQLPEITPFYAVKCCTDPVVLQTLNSYGVNFDCSNMSEIKMVLEMGVSPDRIVYANTIKSSSHLDFASEHGVTLMTFDCMEELGKISDKNARLLLRIASNETGSGITMNNKFGCRLEDAGNLLQIASFMGFKVVGIAFHVGAAYRCPDIFARSIAEARSVFDEGIWIGHPMTVLDIGGGFTGGLRSHDKLLKLCKTIRLAVDEYFPASSGVRVIAEPGQFFVTSAYTLVTRVVAERRKDIEISGKLLNHKDIFINESLCNCINRDLFRFMDIGMRPLNPPYERPCNFLSTVWGATCNPLDCILDKQPLFEVFVNEWLLMDNMGAYTLVGASGFNGFGFPPVHYVASAAGVTAVCQVLKSMSVRSGYGHMEQLVKHRRVENQHLKRLSAAPGMFLCAE